MSLSSASLTPILAAKQMPLLIIICDPAQWFILKPAELISALLIFLDSPPLAVFLTAPLFPSLLETDRHMFVRTDFVASHSSTLFSPLQSARQNHG